MIVANIEKSADSENRYDLSDDQVVQLTTELIDEYPHERDDRFVCYTVDGWSRYANIARKIECDVFYDAFGNDPEEMMREYGPYEEQSQFFISVDREERAPTGVLRIIKNGPAGLKTFNDLEEDQPNFSTEEAMAYHGIESLDDCWEFGTIAVPEAYRQSQGGPSLQLYRGMYLASQEAGIKHYVSLIDEGPYLKMKDFLGIPYKPLHGAQPTHYLGSEKSLPVYGDAQEFEKAVRRKRWTVRGFMARKAIKPLLGSKDSSIQFYK